VLVLFMWGVAKPLSWMPEPIGPVADEFASGTRVTVWLTLAAGLSGIVIGVLTAVAKLAPFPPIRWAADLYVWAVRGTPLLVQVLFVYFALPAIVPGLQLSDFNSAVLALSVNVGATTPRRSAPASSRSRRARPRRRARSASRRCRRSATSSSLRRSRSRFHRS
jgi:polar amino acid transport system permease protein